MHALIVWRESLLTKRRLEVLDAVQSTALASRHCFLLSVHLTDSTNRLYNSATGAHTKLTYPQTELNIMASLERYVALRALLRHPTTEMENKWKYQRQTQRNEWKYQCWTQIRLKWVKIPMSCTKATQMSENTYALNLARHNLLNSARYLKWPAHES